jgi:hypothetical protein
MTTRRRDRRAFPRRVFIRVGDNYHRLMLDSRACDGADLECGPLEATGL